MSDSVLTAAMFNIFFYAGIFIAPPLIISTIAALFIGLLQAVTQIQEQTLPQTVKIIVISVVVMLMGTNLISPLFQQSDQLFSNFYLYYVK